AEASGRSTRQTCPTRLTCTISRVAVDFSRNARVYDDRHSALLDGALAGQLIAAARIGAGARCLDVGAGTGRVSVPFAALGHRMVAIDRSAAMLARTRDETHTTPRFPHRR